MVGAGLTLAVLLLSGAPSDARMCFVSGTTIPTTEGYQQVALTAQALAGETGASLDIFDGTAEQRTEAMLELMRNDVSPILLFVEESEDPSAVSDCVRLHVRSPGGSEAPRVHLWHQGALFFDSGSSELTSVARTTVRFVMPHYQPGRTVISLIAHADLKGSAEANLRLSQARVRATIDALIRMGVRESDIEAVAKGESRPRRQTPDGVSEPLNRRVEIYTRVRP